MTEEMIKSGMASLDELIQGLRLGDNVVWQVDQGEAYEYFARLFIAQAIEEKRRCVYLRFADHPPILAPQEGLSVLTVDHQKGFDTFTAEIHRIIEEQGREAFYVFDSLSSLVAGWATDELLANFFHVTCPYLYDMDTVAYFQLLRGRHSHRTVARIRDTTQLLIDVYQAKGRLYIHPLKVQDRYSPQMYFPHVLVDGRWLPVYQSGAAADLSVATQKKPLYVSAKSTAPWDVVYQKILKYQEMEVKTAAAEAEIGPLKQELSQMLFGRQTEFDRLADKYLSLEDLINIRERMIGSGRIGGKAAGMLLARSILLKEGGELDFSRVLEPHDSFFIGSDVFFTFLVDNGLFKLRLHYSRDLKITPEEFEALEERFLAGHFPAEIMEQFRDLLEYFGQAPIIVRSSSFLEDSFGNAFAGKYRSEFCANQGSPEERLEDFLRAVKLIYASTLNPDALSYRRDRGLGERDEQMAILVQRVSGRPYQKYFFPAIAGVAFSRNLYVWTNRIDPAKGLIRLVFGLGTRAVNRVGNDYPRMIAISHPHLRPEADQRIAKYSQWEMDLLDLEENQLVTKPIREVLRGDDYPQLAMMVSLIKDGYLYDPFQDRWDDANKSFVLTFNNLLKRTDFVKKMERMLTCLEEAYGHPVDTEFTASVDEEGETKINLLQCRPMRVPGTTETIEMPEGIPRQNILFQSGRSIGGGMVPRIRFLLYIDPRRYAAIRSLEMKKSLGRLVGKLNEHPEVIGDKIILMGPGRWGSSNIDLGVNVSYGDINHASVLVEIARREAGHLPEVSCGTHFFLDLVEAQIIYVPLYPDQRETIFNEEFLEGAENRLTQIYPPGERYEEFVKLIDIPFSTGGKFATIIARPEGYKTVCFFAEGQ